MTKKQKLVSLMGEAQQEQELLKNNAQKACQMRQKRKLEAREHLVKKSTESAAAVHDSHDSDDGEDSYVPKSQNKAIKYSCVLDCEMDRFNVTLKETDANQVALEHEKITFERQKYAGEQWTYHQER